MALDQAARERNEGRSGRGGGRTGAGDDDSQSVSGLHELLRDRERQERDKRERERPG